MSWKDINSAPKNRTILLYGHIDPETNFVLLTWSKPCVFSGYWDEIDQAWCCTGSTWLGPFMKCYFWQELPNEPEMFEKENDHVV